MIDLKSMLMPLFLDKAVDKAYGYKGRGDDASRVEFLLKKIADT